MATLRDHLLVVIVSVTVVGCSTLTVSTDYDPDFDFSSLKTYHWLEVDDARIKGARIDNPLINRRINAAIDTVLEGKGYLQTNGEHPDFLVTWLGAIDTNLRYDTISNFYGPYWGRGYYGGSWSGYQRTYATEYEEGTLIIDILTPQDKKLVWRGSGRDFIDNLRTQQQITDKINNTVIEILASFPPGGITK